MKLRFKIQDILVVTILVALPVAFYAPELRSLDRTACVVGASVVITAITLVSFSPVWVVLFRLRRQTWRSLGIRAVDYAIVFVAFLLSLGLIVGIFVASTMIVVR